MFNPSIDFYRGKTSYELVFRGVSIFPWAGRCWEFSINLHGRLKCGKCEQYQLCQHCCSADRFNTCRSRARHTHRTHTRTSSLRAHGHCTHIHIHTLTHTYTHTHTHVHPLNRWLLYSDTSRHRSNGIIQHSTGEYHRSTSVVWCILVCHRCVNFIREFTGMLIGRFENKVG